ncbi:MAG TPA: efflux RND transporter periplasmic adaptor subunit [Thermoanaerobaculia bacterium]
MTRVSAALVIGAPLLVGACTAESTTPPAEVRPVRTVVVDPKSVADDRRAVGEVRPRYESDLGFRVSGKIVARTVDVGASAKKGDLLARLDDGDYRNKLKSADADLVAAHAGLVEAQASEARYRQLLAGGVTTRANYDSALKNLRSAEAKVDSAKASLDLAKDQLAYTELRADFDGIVAAASAEPGQVVNTGQMVIRLARPDDKDAVFAIAESVFGGRSINGERPEIVVALLSHPSVSAEGVVREISPVADPSTRTYQVKVTLKNPPEQMRFGSSVVGRLKASSAPVVVLPGNALFDKGGLPAVWVVDPKDDSLVLKTVVVSRYEADRVVLKDGLSAGDIVVTAGVNRLRENQKVQLAGGGL